jgi:hypothetical protein
MMMDTSKNLTDPKENFILYDNFRETIEYSIYSTQMRNKFHLIDD